MSAPPKFDNIDDSAADYLRRRAAEGAARDEKLANDYAARLDYWRRSLSKRQWVQGVQVISARENWAQLRPWYRSPVAKELWQHDLRHSKWWPDASDRYPRETEVDYEFGDERHEFELYTRAHACHWLANLHLFAVSAAWPDHDWRIVTSELHSFVARFEGPTAKLAHVYDPQYESMHGTDFVSAAFIRTIAGEHEVLERLEPLRPELWR